MRFLRVCLLAAALAPAVARAEMPHFNNKLKAGKAVTARAIVLPAQINLVRLGFKGAESMEQDASGFSNRFYDAVRAELSARGVTVLPNPADSVPDNAARYRIADLRSKFDHLRVPLRRKPARVAKGGFTMGDGVATFQPGQADVLVFLRGEGYVTTRGLKAVSAVVLNPVGALSRFRCDATFVDALSGEVLAFLRLNLWRDLSRESNDRLQEIVHRTMKPMPLPKPAPK